MISVTRTHEICAGHRVVGHEGHCKNLHGHGYLFELTLTADELDHIGRVIDFGIIKSVLCQWLEDEWDHKMLLWEHDSVHYWLTTLYDHEKYTGEVSGIVSVPFNPTAENIAQYFCETIAPGLLNGTGVKLVEVKLWETSKCYATYRVKEMNDNTFRNGRRNVEEEKSSSKESIR